MKKYFVFLVAVLFFLDCRSITRTAPEDKNEKNTVVLSFDDGPNSNGNTTERLLDVLKKHNIRAMFSVIGINAEKNPELILRIYNEGHIIINHGYSEKWALYMKEEEFLENLLEGERAIMEALGKDPWDSMTAKLYRPHGGFYKEGHEIILRERGWTIVNGNIRAWDASGGADKKEKVFKMIMRKTRKNNGGIILLHDGKNSYSRMEAQLEKNPSGSYNRSWIPELTEEIIKSLVSEGYVFIIPRY